MESLNGAGQDVNREENLVKKMTEVFLGFYPKEITQSLGRIQSGCDEVAI